MAGHLNALGLPAHLDEKAELEDELGGITSRLKRVLSRFDDENEETEEAAEFDEREAFQTRYQSMTTRMEAMAQERSTLLSSLAQWLETAEDESETPRPTSRESPKSPTETEHVTVPTLDNTLMGVKKLKKLNEDMVQQAVQGRDMEHLAKEEAILQQKVVQKFKQMLNAGKRKVIGKTFGAHWKHASEEIVALLARIRKEGVTGIDELEAQIGRASRSIQRQAEEMQRLEQKLYGKDQEIEKLTLENSTVTSDNLLLTSEKERYRDQIMKYRKTLKKLRQEAKTPEEPSAEFSDDEEEELKRLISPVTPVASPYQTKQKKTYGKRQKKTPSTAKKAAPSVTVTPAGKGRTVSSSVQERPVSPDRAGGSQYDEMWHLEEENFDMKEKVLVLEKKVIEKEHKMISLEHQIHELIETIKNTTPELLSKLNEELNIRGPSAHDIATAIQNAADEAIEEGKMVARIPTKDPDRTNKNSKSTKKPSLSGDVNSQAPRDSASVPSSIPSASTVQQQVKPEVDPEVVQLLQRETDALQQELKNAKTELRRAQWELISLRHDNSQRGMVPSLPNLGNREIPQQLLSAAETDAVASGKEKPTPSMLRMLLEMNGREENTDTGDDNRTARGLANIRMQDYLPTDAKEEATGVEYDDEFQAYADLIRAERGKFKQRLYTRPKMVGVVRHDGRKSMDSSSTPNRTDLEEFAVEDQGMQTDPTLDPLGAWSNIPTIKMKDKMKGSKKSIANANVVQPKAGPLPPKEWALFDPTALQDLATDHMRVSLRDLFEKKAAPKHIDSCNDLINFVEGELRRLTQGISGYTGYLNKLIEHEVSSMTNTNESMRRKLSDATLKRMDRMRALSAEKGQEKGEDVKTGDKEAPPIRRGRFEIAKPGKKSRYSTKKAFGSYYSGQRFLIQQGVPEQLQIQRFNAGGGGQPYPWETYARDHIYKAEMEAAERSEPQTRGGSRGPGCDILKQQVDQIAQHAVDVLKGTTVFFKETLTKQLEEFDVLHGAVQLKDELKAMTPVSDIPTAQKSRHGQEDGRCDSTLPNALKICRSTSHSSFLERRPTEVDDHDKVPGAAGPATTPKDELLMPAQTHSMTSIQSSHRLLPPLLLYKETEPRNRDQYKLPKATLPKKGMINLAVTDISSKATQNDENKPFDSKRRHRPAPQTHNRLQSKQKALLRNTNVDTADDMVETTTLLDLRNQLLELPVGFYGSPPQRENVSSKVQFEVPMDSRRLILNAEDQLWDETNDLNKYTAVLAHA